MPTASSNIRWKNRGAGARRAVANRGAATHARPWQRNAQPAAHARNCARDRSVADEADPVALVNPRWVRAFARSIGQLAKTGRIDARVLALYAERTELKLREPPDEQTRELRALCARRDDLLDMIEAERNRLEHAPPRMARDPRAYRLFAQAAQAPGR
ncbi:MAG: IS110 family transposase [Candidatus Binataceae bacterium]